MSDSNTSAFNPLGNTICVKSDASAPLGKQAPVNSKYSSQPAGCFRFANTGTAWAYVGVASTAAQAQTDADSSLVLASGDPADVVAIAPGSVEIMRFGADCYFSSLSTSALDLYITPGAGL